MDMLKYIILRECISPDNKKTVNGGLLSLLKQLASCII